MAKKHKAKRVKHPELLKEMIDDALLKRGTRVKRKNGNKKAET